MPSRSIHVAANGKISFFYGWIIFHYMCVCMCIYIYIYNIMSQTVGHDWVAKLIYIYIYKYINVHKHTHTHIMRESAYPCPTLCNPMDCSLPGSFVHGILQARIQEWVAIPFSSGSFRPRDGTWISCIIGRCLHCKNGPWRWPNHTLLILALSPWESHKASLGQSPHV